MGEGKITYALAGATFILFLAYFHRKKEVRTYLLFSMYSLPFMNLLATKVTWGGFKLFDIITLYCLLFFPKKFLLDIIRSQPFYKIALFTLIILLLLGSLKSEFSFASLLTFIETIPLFIFLVFLAGECKENPNFFNEILSALKFSYVIALIFVAAQLLIGLKFTFYPDLNSNTLDSLNNAIRYPGMFHDSQAHGQFLALGSFLFLHPYNAQGNTRQALLNYILFGTVAIALLLSGSRSALGGFVVAVAIIFLSSNKNFRLASISLSIVGLLVFSALSPDSSSLQRLNTVGDDYKFRKAIWTEAYYIAEANPLLGIGLGTFQSYTKRHNQDLFLEIGDEIVYFDQPESGYLKILSETGFICFGLFIGTIVYSIVSACYLYIRNPSNKIILLLLCSAISWLIAFNSVYTLFDIRISIVVLTVCVMLTTAYNTTYSYESSK